MRKFLLLISFLLVSVATVFATHNIAGEITYEPVGSAVNGVCLTYKIRVTTYTNSLSQADRCDLEVQFGDGSAVRVPRSNGATGGACGSAGQGSLLSGYPDTKVNYYDVIHTYPASGTYKIIIVDPNRISNIDNIPNSVNVPFYLESRIVISPLLGCNASPQLTSIPLDDACAFRCFYHSPGAYDPDGDSLVFSLEQITDTLGNPLPGYFFPPTTSTLSIDRNTGLFEWCAPPMQGIFNIVIKIEQFRRIPGGVFSMGYVKRDMEIVVGTCSNSNPVLPELPDLCVDAGTQINFVVTATDPDATDFLQLSATGGPFAETPAASFPTVGFAPQPLSQSFIWNTTCEQVRKNPFQVVFRVEDNDAQIHLLDFEVVNITVVAPAPANLVSVPQGQTMLLNWDQSICDPVNNGFVRYKIYRRIGLDTNAPAPCETGVPAAWGYTQIGSSQGLANTSFVDNNNGTGLIPGVTYCYRVVAEFADGAESYSSEKTCAELLRDIPIITHVDVDSTSVTSGEIIVRWAKPDPSVLDTLNAYPGPFRFEIYRTSGTVVGSNPVLVSTVTAPYFAALNDSIVDANLNTVIGPYSYRVDFYSGSTLVGSTQSASSLFVTATPSDNTVSLSWTENVPWTNFSYVIYKESPMGSGTFVPYDTVEQRSYVDTGLVNGQIYCYYILSKGSYFNPSLQDTLLNRSQRVCASPRDLTPPCAPHLIVQSNCLQYRNQLFWTNPNNSCSDDVVGYNVYYKPDINTAFSLLATVNDATDTVLLQASLQSVAGCYVVTAVDTFGNESIYSNEVCVENCPVYNLPNVFSPDGDGVNDLYQSFPYRYVQDVSMKIYDRWGVLVFETSDPDILWNGRALSTGELCSDGVYYYICIVNEVRLQGIVPRELRGFIHLLTHEGGQNP